MRNRELSKPFRIGFRRVCVLMLLLVLLVSVLPRVNAASYNYTVNSGDVYTVNVGDVLYLTNPESCSEMAFYAFNWLKDDSGVISESHTENSRFTTVTALKGGTATIRATLDGSVPYKEPHSRYNYDTKRWETYYVTKYRTYNYERVITIRVNDPNPPATPAGLTASGTEKGITLKWNAISRAASYSVYRSVNNDFYKKIDTVTTAGYVDTTAKSGTTYYYKIRAINGSGIQGNASRAVSARYVASPATPHKIVNVVSGVHVYWKAVGGASKYGVWRSETGVNGEYKWIANPKVPHFTDTTVQSGKTYYYRVSAVNSKDGTHTSKSGAVGITYVSTPDITSRFNKAAGITVGWKKISGATGYRVYRKSYSGSDGWVKVADIPSGSTLSWTDTSVRYENGTVYRYTVRALYKNTLSGCRSNGRTMARLSSLFLTDSDKASATSIKVGWTTSSAVTGYEVRFMVGSKVYKTVAIGNYKTGIKTFTGLKAGQTYKIQARSYKKIDGMGFYSAWSTAKTVTLP